MVYAAFRDLHGARLHGFGLIVTLGDRRLAARITGDALVAGAARASELRHPERAAAWLRQRVLDRSAHARRRSSSAVTPDATVALADLGLTEPAVSALAMLSARERAALVADAVEGLDRRDIATIVGADGSRLDRLISHARERYLNAAVHALRGDPPAGPTVDRIHDVAERSLR